jgi:pSer/pThr/pTyr-binding forkhead associated (FHA) protein
MIMARLLIKAEGLEERTLELRLGVNHVGRDPDCDFPISHPTVSSSHCELVLSSDGVLLRDCGSTNGTYVNGDPIQEAWLRPGQTVSLGEVELFVENTEVNVAIPRYERERPRPPVVLPDGALSCPRHPQMHATYQCTHCREVMCDSCVHVIRFKGGQPLFLCPLCSQKCEPIAAAKPKKKKTFIRFLRDTVKIRFRSSARRERAQK